MSASQSSAVPLLQMRGIKKRFPGVIALSGVNFQLYAGEVLALVGENGAGKSTLMNILAGLDTSQQQVVRGVIIILAVALARRK